MVKCRGGKLIVWLGPVVGYVGRGIEREIASLECERQIVIDLLVEAPDSKTLSQKKDVVNGGVSWFEDMYEYSPSTVVSKPRCKVTALITKLHMEGLNSQLSRKHSAWLS